MDGAEDEPAQRPAPRLRRALPWISLGLSVAGAVMMDRRPERAWLIAVAAGGAWVLLGLLGVVANVDPARLPRHQAVAARVARFSAQAGAQSLLQLGLFFSLPFFARAAGTPGHWVFVALLGVAAALTLWDPLYEAILARPAAATALHAAGTFATLDCVLPLLGLSNRLGLALAALGAAAGALVTVRSTWRRRLTAAGAVALALGGALFAGGAAVVPPAPLRLVTSAIGTRIEHRELVDPITGPAPVPHQLVCATAIAAPRGLRDQLRHVWRQDGAVRGVVALEVRGGRAEGFRTWSVRRHLGPGRWSCTVETASGQRLGRAAVTLVP